MCYSLRKQRNIISARCSDFKSLSWTRFHNLLLSIETTDVIRKTENKKVKRNMSRYFQHIFMLFPLSFGYLFYDTCVIIIIRKIWPTYVSNMVGTIHILKFLLLDEC